jgi:hypothetical protein
VYPQTPLLQVAAALGGVGHWMPQPLQLLGSVRMLISQPSAALALQSA